MSDQTGIEWTDATWNPVTGCTKVSAGCDYCYAETFAERWRGTPGHHFERGFDVQLRPEKLELPLSWRKPRKVFVNSMSDLFHEAVPDRYIAKVFHIMATAPRHTFQVLTKRHARMRSLLNSVDFVRLILDNDRRSGFGATNEQYDEMARKFMTSSRWPLPNVWLGVSTEDQKWADLRIPSLLETPAAVHWISAEPLLGPIDLTRIKYTAGGGTHLDVVNGRHGEPGVWTTPAQRLDWVVVGGESGHGARPMHPTWARTLRDQCESADVPYLFKQKGAWTWEARLGNPDGTGRDAWADREPDAYVNAADGRVADENIAMANGGDWAGVYRVGKRRAGRVLDGELWDQYPATGQLSTAATA